MKNYTKFTAIFLVLAVALSVPALAASSGWNTVNITSDDWRDMAYYAFDNSSNNWYPSGGTLQEATNRLSFPIPALDDSDPGLWIGFSFEADTSFTLSAGDIVKVESFVLRYFIGGAANYIDKYGLQFGYVDDEEFGITHGNAYLISDAYETGFTSGQAVQDITFPDIELKAKKDCTINTVSIMLHIYHPSGGYLNLTRVPFTFGYGNPSSAETPNYTPPDEKPVDDYVDKEQELLDDTSEGMDIAEGIFNGFGDNLAGFVAGMMFVSNLMSLGISQIPAVGIIVQISLACGLFGVIVGLTGSILGAAERSHRNERRRR